VSDSGDGIPREHLGKIFDPFFSTKERGTGLGLALVQQIVVEHGGRIEVESGPDAGTAFSLTFPALRAPASDARDEPASEARAAASAPLAQGVTAAR
jgi:signal transduction histidine kinase